MNYHSTTTTIFHSLPAFSINSDALSANLNFQNLENTKFSLKAPHQVKNLKCLSFHSKDAQFLCFYYELDHRTNRIEIVKCSRSMSNRIIYSKEVNRGFLDPIIMQYCPTMNLFCCLEGVTVGCHRLGHNLVFYALKGQGMKKLTCLSPYFSELFESFELMSSYKACLTVSRNLISVWSIYSKKRLASTENSENISCLKYLPSLDLVLCGGRRKISVYRFSVKNVLIPLYQLRGHYESITQLCWNPLGENLLSMDYEGRILMWNLSKQEGFLVKEIKCKNNSYFDGMYFFPGTSTLVTMDNHHVSLFDSDTGTLRNSVCDVGKLLGYDTINLCMIFWKGSEINFQNDRVQDSVCEPPLS